LQPCLCDVWHAHVLFVRNELSGIVDYGAVKINHVAADLGRLLGSLVGDDPRRRLVGLAAYRERCTLSAEEEELANLLDRTGTVLGTANWLRWLYYEKKHFEDRQAVASRLAAAVNRMEQI
jgi:homoserine kinase type II